PLILDLGPKYRTWIENIHGFYKPEEGAEVANRSWKRAAGWRCAQALQWAASSPHAGVGYLVRQAIRAGWESSDQLLRKCLAALRPYRAGPADEPIDRLFDRIRKEIGHQETDADLEDIEEYEGDDKEIERRGLASLLTEGLNLLL